MKRLMTTTAAALVLGTAAFAQDDANTDANTEGAATEQSASGFGGVQAEATDFMASDLLGMRLYTTESELPSEDSMVNVAETDWENVGEINDMIVGQNGQIDGVVVGVGGFLGIGEKAVAISMDQVNILNGEAGERFLVIQANKEELEAAPEFQDPQQQQEQEQATGTSTGSGTETGSANTGMEEGEGEGMSGEGAETEAQASADDQSGSEEQAMSEEGSSDEQMAEGESAEGEGENLSEGAEQPEMTNDSEAEADSGEEGASMSVDENAETEGEQSGSTETSGDSGSEDQAMAEEGSSEEQMAEGESAEGEQQAAEEQSGGEEGSPSMEREGYQNVDLANVTADDLTGATVYDTNDESLGNVNDLVLAEDGSIDQVVIDVGGFLGIGSKQVALPYSEMQVMAAGETMSDIRVYVDRTEDELENMEEYQPEQ